jgi:hypothetical protein
LLLGILITGAAVALVVVQRQKSRVEEPSPPATNLPPPATTLTPQGDVPQAQPPPVVPRDVPPPATTRPPRGGTSRADAGGRADAGTARSDGGGLPFPGIPFPSGFPQIPTTFPSALPPGFPQFPGMPGSPPPGQQPAGQ